MADDLVTFDGAVPAAAEAAQSAAQALGLLLLITLAWLGLQLMRWLTPRLRTFSAFRRLIR